MNYEWDPRKAAANLAKHNVEFAHAALVLEDDLALTIRDPDSWHEEKFITVGMDPLGRMLTVVFTWRQDRIRIISARKATRQEIRDYESN